MQADFLQDDEWLSELTQDTRGVLKLRHDIMEHICRFLSQQDLMQLCQVSPTWSPAAKAVLWEAPVFKDPESLKLFVASAFPRKSLALQVKHLSLCLRDEDYPTVFRPVLDSTLFRHNKENLLWSASLITQLARQCENIETLKLYGWRLNPMHIEQIGATLTHLRSISIIGANDSFQQPFVLRNTVAKLHELRLDGHFVLSLPFASMLASRASLLRSLHVPIMGMEREALTALCSGSLNLTHLTLTYASPMTDGDVQEVLSRFVNLKAFTLHGTEKVTANIIATAISKCRRLESLELRADPKSFKKHTGTDWSTTTASTSTSMKRLVIENMIVPDSVMWDLSQSCNSLTTLGLFNCRDVSDSAMAPLLEANNHLQLFHVIRCPGISDQTLAALGKSEARQTIQNVHFESSGDLSPQAIHQLCCAATEYSLRHLRFVDYPNLAQSDIGTYGTERDVNDPTSPRPIVTLDERAIDAIATASRYDFAPMPKNRFLTGEQLLRLAKELNIGVEELEDAIERVKVDSELDDEAKEQSEPEQASASPEFEDSEAEQFPKPLSRMTSLKNQHRPTTPAIWAAHGTESEIQKYLPQSTADNSPAPRYSRLSQRAALMPESEPEPVPESADDFEDDLRESRSQSPISDEQEVQQYGAGYDAKESAPAAPYMEEEEPISAVQEEWPSLGKNSPADKKGAAGEVELGGWGVHNSNVWSKKVSGPSKQEAPPARKQADQPWVPYTAERHEHQWQQTTLEPRSSRSGGRNQRPSFTMQNDGWGRPKTHIAWDDLRHQGFAHEVLEQQKQTAFWDNTTKQWTTPNKSEPAPAQQASQSKLATVAWPSIAEAKTPAKKPLTGAKQPNKRAPEPLSDDEEKINWDVDDGVTIKTSPTLGPQYRQQNGPTKGKPLAPMHPGSPQWNPMSMWNIRQSPAAIDHPERDDLHFGLGFDEGWDENTRSTKPAPADKPRNDDGGSAQWRDFAALTVAEQVARSYTGNARADPQSDLLIDTSDVVNGKSDDLDARPSTRKSFDSSIWKDVESLTPDNSPPQDQQVKDQFNDLVDTSDVIMSPSTELSTAPSMQQPLIPLVNKVSSSSPKPSGSTPSSARKTPEPEISHDIQSVAASQGINDTHAIVANESTLEMDLLGTSAPQSAATPPSSSEGQTTPPAQSGPGKRVGSFAFEVPDKKLPPLNCYENIDVEDSVRQFCDENNIPDFYDNILRSIRPAYNDRRTKMILNSQRKKKNKKRTQHPQTPPP
ncbi:hypothetical protein BJV82DRAFT_716938 [Fennellomyces sp. T-0311]|nr:hypothetical protein BJV82DRAFT_716938 [Fennellomyces sp. T-0311]